MGKAVALARPLFESAGYVMRSSVSTRRAISILLLCASTDKDIFSSRYAAQLQTLFRFQLQGAVMNDPGLHESANDAAEDVEDEQAEQEEQEYLDPRYGVLRYICRYNVS